MAQYAIVCAGCRARVGARSPDVRLHLPKHWAIASWSRAGRAQPFVAQTSPCAPRRTDARHHAAQQQGDGRSNASTSRIGTELESGGDVLHRPGSWRRRPPATLGPCGVAGQRPTPAGGSQRQPEESLARRALSTEDALTPSSLADDPAHDPQAAPAPRTATGTPFPPPASLGSGPGPGSRRRSFADAARSPPRRRRRRPFTAPSSPGRRRARDGPRSDHKAATRTH